MLKKLALTLLSVLFTLPVFAQLEIGASYELRNENPQNGIGLRVQTGILKKIPTINLGLRLHASYFNEEQSINVSEQLNREINYRNFDYGLALFGGIGIGLLEPYAGLGIGAESSAIETLSERYITTELPVNQKEDETNFYWNSFIGAKVTVIPLVKPFVEFRVTNRDIELPNISDQTGRIMFGVILSL